MVPYEVPEAVSVSPETVGEDEEPVEGSSTRQRSPSKRSRVSIGSTRKKLKVAEADEVLVPDSRATASPEVSKTRDT